MALKIAFGDYDFAANNVAIENWKERSNSKVKERDIALHDGSYAKKAMLESRRIDFKGTILGTTKDGLQTAFNLFKNAINNGKQKLFLFDDILF